MYISKICEILHLRNIPDIFGQIFQRGPADTWGRGVWLDRKTFWPKYSNKFQWIKKKCKKKEETCFENSCFENSFLGIRNMISWEREELSRDVFPCWATDNFFGLLNVRAALVMAFKWEKLLFQLSEKQEIIQVFRQDRTFRFQLGSILTINAKLARSMFSKQDWALTWMNELTKTMDKNDLQSFFSCVLYYCPF